MISFIIFESDKYLCDLYGKIIRKFLYTTKDYYDIYEFQNYNCNTIGEISKIYGKKIYLINTELPGIKDGFELARKIRASGDVDASIIMIQPKGKRISIKNIRNTMVLNVIENNSKLMIDLYNTIETAYKIATRYNVLSFSSFDEVYRIPYDDILYIEKNLCEDLVTVYTKDDTYVHYISIKRLMKKLESDPRFCKCSRSCIINLYNVDTFHCTENLIVFKNGVSINLVSRYQKAQFVDRLKKEKLYIGEEV